MKQPTNTQPLYKVLNEQRRLGKWKVNSEPHKIKVRSLCHVGTLPNVKGSNVTDHPLLVVWGNTQEECAANAHYTALAVNNLHHIAENLERLIDRIEETNLQNDFPSAYKRAKEALARIS